MRATFRMADNRYHGKSRIPQIKNLHKQVLDRPWRGKEAI